MAEAVTYADLKFNEIPMKEIKTAVDFQENDVDDGDVTYENVTGTKPSSVRPEPPTFPTRPKRPPRTGFWSTAPFPMLLLLLASVMLLASTIGLTVKYIDLSHQFHHLSVSHMELISNGSQSLERWRMEKEKLGWDIIDLNTSLLERKEDAEERLKETMSLIENLNTSLLESLQKVKTSTDEKETAEGLLKKAQKRMSQIEELNKGCCTGCCAGCCTDLCPKNWILFGKTCLLFSERDETWEKSKTICEDEGSHMIVVQKYDDTALKDFLAKKQGDFWVGKELKRTYSYPYQQWEWPEPYDYTYNNGCWKLSNGELMTEHCKSKNKCICQKNLLLTSMKADTSRRNYFSFSLWDLEYKCRHSY